MATKSPQKSSWSIPPRNPKSIRIALFGRRSAGKTCFLAAINMPRIAHPEGLSCTLKPFEKGEHEAFQKGWTKIQDAAQRIEGGESPLATPNSDLLAFHLRVGAPGRGKANVEMIDYSGELLDSVNSDTLADSLMEHLRASDAAIVLAEFPSTSADTDKIPGELNRLGQAFNRLKEKCPELPVAFVVNKWDRNPALHDSEPTLHEQAEHLHEFLNTEPLPFHSSLRNQIMNATGKRFREFPVSVFGQSQVEEFVDDTGKKRFRENPVLREGQLESFGLEDALFWLVTEVKKSKKRKFFRTLSKAVLLAIILASLAIGFDEYRFRDLVGIVESSTATDDEIEAAETKLKPYFDPANPLHLVMHQYRPAEEIRILADQSRDARDERAWERVTGIHDQKDRAQAAENYIANFPQGKFRSNANATAEEYKASEKVRLAEELVGTFKSELKIIRQQDSETSLDSISTLESRISEALQGSNLPAGISSEINDIGNELRQLRSMAIAEKDIADRKKEFANLFQEQGKALEAGQLLADLTPKTRGEFESEINLFRETALDKLKNQLEKDSFGGRNWKGAVESLNEFLEAVAKPNTDLLPLDAMNQLGEIKKTLEVEGDRRLYQAVIDEPDSRKARALEAYLSDAPIQSMRKECEASLAYLRKIESPLDLHLVLETIRWSKTADENTDNWVLVEIDNIVRGRAKGPFESVHGAVSRSTGDQANWFIGKRKLDDVINLRVTINDHGKGLTNKAEVQGSTSADVSLKNFMSSKTFSLEGTAGGTELRFRIDGLPERPELPPYQSPK